MKKCRVCKHFKPITSFFKNGYRRTDGTSGTRNDCKACNKKVHDDYVVANRDKLNQYMKSRYTQSEKRRIREYGLKRMYGLTPNDYDALLKKQNGKCAVCSIDASYIQNGSIRSLDVDHNHSTGKIRGLCCIRCNRAMGLFRDDPKIVRKAVSYLEKNKN